MKGLSGRSRFLLAVLVAAAVGGAAAGIVLAREGPGSAKGAPGVVARGHFKTLTWGTTGSVSIVRDASGRLKLHLGKDFSTQRSPELYVYLARYAAGERKGGKEVSLLRRAWGSQDYLLRGANASASSLHAVVEIICAKCGQTNGIAQLEPTRRGAGEA
jgi:hypothetical protein